VELIGVVLELIDLAKSTAPIKEDTRTQPKKTGYLYP